ncbi:MAG TPA: GNAT family N-acetyltransferase [Acidimicrobiales bacterium]
MESARVATAADLDFVAELWERAVAELDGQRGGSLLAGSLYRSDPKGALRFAFDDPDRIVVIGRIEDVAVGFALAVCDRQRREPVGVIEIVYVDPQARQVGVAESMVKVVMKWSDERGCVGVDAPALPGSRSAKAFFEDNGFIARLLIMHRPVNRKNGDDDG